jgi:endonuclease G
MRKSITLLFLLWLTFTSFAQQHSNVDFEIPELKKGEQLIRHAGFSLVYNEPYEQASWVAYEITADETIKRYERTNHFLADPKISTGSADNADYKGRGYDKGHLAPAGDMEWSAESCAESFYFSNMSPQVPAFNRGIWETLEEFVRTNAVISGAVYVVTGPILQPGLSVIGHNQVAIPAYYYKVILDYRDPVKKGIGFMLQNQESHNSIQVYAMSIDEVEKNTGINFFPSLTKDEEKLLESHFDLNAWNWGHEKSQTSTTVVAKNKSTSVQCSGTTKKGARCKKMTTNANGRCNLHQL